MYRLLTIVSRNGHWSYSPPECKSLITASETFTTKSVASGYIFGLANAPTLIISMNAVVTDRTIELLEVVLEEVSKNAPSLLEIAELLSELDW